MQINPAEIKPGLSKQLYTQIYPGITPEEAAILLNNVTPVSYYKIPDVAPVAKVTKFACDVITPSVDSELVDITKREALIENLKARDYDHLGIGTTQVFNAQGISLSPRFNIVSSVYSALGYAARSILESYMIYKTALIKVEGTAPKIYSINQDSLFYVMASIVAIDKLDELTYSTQIGFLEWNLVITRLVEAKVLSATMPNLESLVLPIIPTKSIAEYLRIRRKD